MRIKEQILKPLIELIGEKKSIEFREPFFGAGTIGLSLLEKIDCIEKMWINDFDAGISAIWNEVMQNPLLFKSQIRKCRASRPLFYKINDELNHFPTDEINNLALKKFVVHKLGYSGNGVMGGARSEKEITKRWKPVTFCKNIDTLHDLLSLVTLRYDGCTSFDFEKLISRKSSLPCIIYCDPPYYKAGPALYQHSFDENTHKRLSQALKICKHQWLLSYDDCKEIRALYSWAKIKVITVPYCNTGKGVQKKELLITRIIIIVTLKNGYTIKFNLFVI